MNGCKFKCVDSRPKGEYRYRVYKCKACGKNKRTVEFKLDSDNESHIKFLSLLSKINAVDKLSKKEAKIITGMIEIMRANKQ